ncbi:MAG: alpha/beta fold hydrolase [Caldilineaceae bacterium]
MPSLSRRLLFYLSVQCTIALLFVIVFISAMTTNSPTFAVFAQAQAAPAQRFIQSSAILTPALSVAPCSDVIPVFTNKTATCGYVAVPLDHFSLTDTRTISLAVAVYPSTSPTPATDALFILHGGPASSILKSPSVLAGVEFLYVFPFLDQRDVVIFDQRGTGVSIPSLSCSSEAYSTALIAIGKTQSDQEFIDAQNAAYVACRQRLLDAGHTLTKYTSLQNAADVEIIRQALVNGNYIHDPKINLYGASYGTRLALTILREWTPNHLSPHQTGDEANVRSVMIEGVYPPEISGYSRPFAITRALKLMFDECRANPACDQAYPELENVFLDLAEQFRQNPHTYTFTATVDGVAKSYNGLAGESNFVDRIVNSMLNLTDVANVPALIYAIKNGDMSKLEVVPSATEAIERATYFSIVCPEDLLRVSEAEYTTMFNVLKSNFPYLVSSAYRSNISSPRMQDLCQSWGMPLVSTAMRQRVTSAVPTLVIQGNYDINTPPYFGESALQGLSRGQYINIPNLAHAGAGAPAVIVPALKNCPLGLMRSFLTVPTAQVTDTTCLDTLTVEWTLPAPEEIFLPIIAF